MALTMDLGSWEISRPRLLSHHGSMSSFVGLASIGGLGLASVCHAGRAPDLPEPDPADPPAIELSASGPMRSNCSSLLMHHTNGY